MAESFKSKVSNSYESSTRKKQEDVFFVGLKEPSQLRRTVLETSKEAVHTLQQYERFKEVRIEKTKEILRLKGIFKELDNLITKLKVKLPKTSLRVKAAKEEEEAKIIIDEGNNIEEEIKEHRAKGGRKKLRNVKNALVKKPAKRLSEVEKLEAELNDIEEKLGNIS